MPRHCHGDWLAQGVKELQGFLIGCQGFLIALLHHANCPELAFDSGYIPLVIALFCKRSMASSYAAAASSSRPKSTQAIPVLRDGDRSHVASTSIPRLNEHLKTLLCLGQWVQRYFGGSK